MSGAVELFSVPAALPAEFRRPRPLAAFEPQGHASDCPACANSWVLSALRRAAAGLALDPKDLLWVTEGRLCGPWAACLSSYGLEAAAGAALPLALGAKLANPELLVVAAGDEPEPGAVARAARRNSNLLYLRVAPPAKPEAVETNWLALALASGAGFAARIKPGAAERAEAVLTKALQYRGFALVDCALPGEREPSVLGNPRPGERELPLALALAVSPLGLKAEGIFYWNDSGQIREPLLPLKAALNLSAAQKAEILRSFL